MKIKLILLLFISLGFNLSVFAAETISELATAFYSDNNYEKTFVCILNIPELERTAQDWLILGNLYEEKNNNKRASLMYQKAINTQPNYYKAYYNLANIYFKQKEYDTAIKNYNLALKYYKTNPYVYYNCGCSYIKTKNLKKAQAMFEQAIILQNNIPDFYYNLAYVYKSLKKDKMAQTCLDNYNKLVQ